MNSVSRSLVIDLPEGQSAFLWGARKTGKSTLLKQQFPNSIYFDLLKTDLFLEWSKRPYLLREQLLVETEKRLHYPIIIDEVQKVPAILDEVHWLIENEGLSFILCGSSARKLKKGHANLLGGRAWKYEMLPFTSVELKENLQLLKVINQGLIPSHYLIEEKFYPKTVKSYVENYLKEEVFAEGLTRNIPAFSRFFEIIGFCNAELINYSNIARDCGVDAKTVKEYFQILVDTHLGVKLSPFAKVAKRDLVSKTEKFYFFDVGLATYLSNKIVMQERGADFGKAFEHFVLMELLAYRSYQEKSFTIKYWRTKTGLEVDFILGNADIAIEVKGSESLKPGDMKGILAFNADYQPSRAIVVCNERVVREHKGITIMPWKIFLEYLWQDKLPTPC